MRIVLGHRYQRRDGRTSGAVTSAPMPHGNYPFAADGNTYTAEGRFNATGLPSVHDLVGIVRLRAAEKAICDVTLEEYRRGVRAVMGDGGWGRPVLSARYADPASL